MYIVLLLCAPIFAQFGYERTRPVDIWHPFGTTPTPRPKNQALGADEVVVRLPIGDIIGKSTLLTDLPWTPTRDPTEEVRSDGFPNEANALPLKNNVTVFVFLGLPYAEPPVANRRFQPPQRITQLPGSPPYLAFTFGAVCAQDVERRPQPFVNDPYPFTVNEDCLYLNIFTPDASKVSGQSYPVAVFFHGGNFQTGSANDWPAHGLASRGMVVVTVNYRLGAQGFMSLGDSDTGNYGLQDQILALEFVRDYIASFGGDPQAVTIIGHDAGAVSVGLHMQSPYSKNLFRSSVAMSGAEVSYHSTIGKPALAFNNTVKLGRYLGCTQTVAMHVWDCIKTRSMDDIIRASTTIPIEYNRYLFLPAVDGKFVPGNPLYILNNAPIGRSLIPSPVPLLIGMNAQDGSEVVLEDRYLGEFNDFNNVDHEYLRSFALEYSFRHNYSMNREAISEAIIDRYTYWPDIANEWMIREEFVQFATDAFYTSPICLSAHLHSSSGSRTFMYVNNYNFSRDEEQYRFIPGWMGVCRECDLYMLFGYGWLAPQFRPYHLRNVTFTEMDKNASQVFSNIVRRFVTYQDPNFLHDGSWAPYQPRRHWYMNFNYSSWSQISIPGVLERDYRYTDVAFWNEYIPALVNYMTTTFPPIEVSVRRQLVTFQIICAVITGLLLLAAFLAASFAYMLCNRPDPDVKESQNLVEYSEHFNSGNLSSEPRARSAVSVL